MLVAEAGVMCFEDRERGHEPRNVASPGRWRRQMNQFSGAFKRSAAR